MNIVLLHNSFYPYAGGIGTSLYFGGVSLVGDGHKVMVITSKINNSDPNYEELDGVHVFRYKRSPLPMVDFIFPGILAFRTRRLLNELRKQEKIDLIVGRSLHTSLGIFLPKWMKTSLFSSQPNSNNLRQVDIKVRKIKDIKADS